MTEQEQLTQQRDEAQKQLVVLQAWMNVKKNIQSKFPGPHEAYKGLIKQGAANLTAEDFKDYLKGQDISTLIAEQNLNEENFVKQWENWTFRFNQTQHKLQMLEEKLELLQMLDNQPTTSSFKNDINKKKQIVNQIQACDSLESLESKLSTIVQNNQKNPPQDLVQGEDLAFSAISKPAEKQSQPIELTISKIQLKDQQKVDKPPTLGADGKPVQADTVVVKTQLVESQIIYEGKMPQTKKTYLDATIARKPSRKQNQLSPIQQQITPPNLLTQKQTYIQESRGSGLANFYSPPTTKYREREEPDFKLKTQLQQNGSNKAKKMKNDLSNYISELFVQGETRSFDQPTSQRGLGGLKNMNRYFSAGKQSQAFESPNQQYSGNNVQKRVLMIRQKLQTLNTLGRQNNTYSPPSYQRAPVIDNYTPTRSSPKPRGFSQNKSPYQPGDTKRLNLDKLLQEKGQLGGSQATPQP